MKNYSFLISFTMVFITFILVFVLSFAGTRNLRETTDMLASLPDTDHTVTESISSDPDASYPNDGDVWGSEPAELPQYRVLTPINQHPELPTGCEVTSLTMLLNYYGMNADKCDVADNYLTKGAVGTVDFRVAFEGDPRDPDSYGCYAPVIVDAANRYLNACGSDLTATDISGHELESLFAYIDGGDPVIIWGTLDCAEGYPSTVWNVDGKELQWITPEHCMVLVDYSETEVVVADPFYGEVRSFDIETFRKGYDLLYKQAVIFQ